MFIATYHAEPNPFLPNAEQDFTEYACFLFELKHELEQAQEEEFQSLLVHNIAEQVEVHAALTLTHRRS